MMLIVFQLEAIRLCPIEKKQKVLAGFFSGTAVFDGHPSEGVCVMTSSVYANQVGGQLKLQCDHSEKQYEKLFLRARIGQEISVGGILWDATKEIILKASQFSFLSKAGARAGIVNTSMALKKPDETNSFFSPVKKRVKTEPNIVKDFVAPKGKKTLVPIKDELPSYSLPAPVTKSPVVSSSRAKGKGKMTYISDDSDGEEISIKSEPSSSKGRRRV
jgi:hypothetical protein